jgi:hypothetical protein
MVSEIGLAFNYLLLECFSGIKNVGGGLESFTLKKWDPENNVTQILRLLPAISGNKEGSEKFLWSNK